MRLKMLQQALKEVKSDEAKREIGVALIAIKRMQEELGTAMRDDNAIKDAIKLCVGYENISLKRRLKRMLPADYDKPIIHDFEKMHARLTKPKKRRRVISRKNYRSSKYHGVNWVESRKKWQARLTRKGITYNLGFHKIETDARDAVIKFKDEIK